jgi:hypothetical protein
MHPSTPFVHVARFVPLASRSHAWQRPLLWFLRRMHPSTPFVHVGCTIVEMLKFLDKKSEHLRETAKGANLD